MDYFYIAYTPNLSTVVRLILELKVSDVDEKVSRDERTKSCRTEIKFTNYMQVLIQFGKRTIFEEWTS